MGLRLFFFWLVLTSIGCGVSQDPMSRPVRKLQRGATHEDTSYVYSLPFETGKSFRIMQGYFGSFTHKDRIALDFAMKRGTTVCAARGGVVVRVKEDGDRGGYNKKYRPYGNNVVIQHADGSRSGYWHLQHNGVLVNVGDTVRQGQVIARSGKTGYAAVPHLHFVVWRSDQGSWTQIPTRFATSRGVRYLRPWRKYRHPRNAALK